MRMYDQDSVCMIMINVLLHLPFFSSNGAPIGPWASIHECSFGLEQSQVPLELSLVQFEYRLFQIHCLVDSLLGALRSLFLLALKPCLLGQPGMSLAKFGHCFGSFELHCRLQL